jgi:flagellar basal body-associated protein FliL
MNPAEYNALHIVHVLSIILMGATAFYATAGAPETRKKTLMWSGIASLLAVLTGGRMAMAIYHGMPLWIWVKLVCWLGLSAFVGIAYKRREKAALWITLTVVLTAVAVVMVYTRPTF